jgi:ABC-type branched-subunit amino acid transport system substrate-binding protein
MPEFVARYRDNYRIYPPDWAIMAYDAVKLWAEGVEKAGSVDADELVGALEGHEFDSLRGKLTIRPSDHQASAPLFSGTVRPNREVGFPTYKDVEVTPGDQVWLSEDDVKKLQGDSASR